MNTHDIEDPGFRSEEEEGRMQHELENPPPQRNYKDLGNLSAVEGWASVGLSCDKCNVKWVGCFDAAACPQCGDHSAWDKLMEQRNYY